MNTVLFRYHRQQICAQLLVNMINVTLALSCNYATQTFASLLQTLHCSSTEAFTHGNASPLFERNFTNSMGPIIRATLEPSQWSHRIPLGIKSQIVDVIYPLIPLVFCGLSSLDTTASQSKMEPEVQVTSTKDNYLFVNVFALTCLFRQIKFNCHLKHWIV